jgi:L-gulonate 3-dehydrogenase
MERLAAVDTILASSTSGIVASAFAEDSPIRSAPSSPIPSTRPMLVPLVEVVPGPATAPRRSSARSR